MQICINARVGVGICEDDISGSSEMGRGVWTTKCTGREGEEDVSEMMGLYK